MCFSPSGVRFSLFYSIITINKTCRLRIIRETDPEVLLEVARVPMNVLQSGRTRATGQEMIDTPVMMTILDLQMGIVMEDMVDMVLVGMDTEAVGCTLDTAVTSHEVLLHHITTTTL